MESAKLEFQICGIMISNEEVKVKKGSYMYPDCSLRFLLTASTEFLGCLRKFAAILVVIRISVGCFCFRKMFVESHVLFAVRIFACDSVPVNAL